MQDDLRPDTSPDDQDEKLSKTENLLMTLLFMAVLVFIYFQVFSLSPPLLPPERSMIPGLINCNNLPLMGELIDDPNLNELVSKIKNDLGRSESIINIFTGPYKYCRIYNAALIDDLYVDDYHYIVFDTGFYKSLEPSMISTIIAHEMGHLNAQIDADNNAIKYFGPDAVLDMLNRTIDTIDNDKQLEDEARDKIKEQVRQTAEFKLRIANAQKAKKLLQKN